MVKKISPLALQSLKEALTCVVYRKVDLRQFVEVTIENKAIVGTINWEGQKFESASLLIDRMAARLDIYENDLLLLFREVSNVDDFSHFTYWEQKGKVDLTKKAKAAVEKLRKQTQGYFDILEEKEKGKERKQQFADKIKKSDSFQEKLSELNKKFLEIAIISDAQKRGFLLEKFLNELFHLFDLDPKGAFKIRGEQIDGAFTFENSDYLLEAKWQKAPIIAADLYVFGGKISGKLKNTLGLFVSIDGFSSECLTNSPQLQSMILMDGMDLMMILEGRVSLDQSIFLKRRHAAETGEIYYKLK